MKLYKSHKYIKSLKYAIIQALSFPALICMPLCMRADVYEDYIYRYCELARQQQAEYNIPASITLAQGILESGAGRSKLASEGNNHFGIKCHTDWDGETMLRNDDKPNECFRVYDSPEESFRDHSLFLKKKRYSPLFELEITDYQGWARGLKKCGYATGPNYADKLIAIIERYALYNYDTMSFSDIEANVDFIREFLAASHPIRKNYGLHYVVAFPGDTYASIAKEFSLKESDLRKYNDAGKNQQITEWEEVYLQQKNDEAPSEVSKATIGDDESIRSIAQRYGVKLETIKKLNKKAKDKPGTVLKLH